MVSSMSSYTVGQTSLRWMDLMDSHLANGPFLVLWFDLFGNYDLIKKNEALVLGKNCNEDMQH